MERQYTIAAARNQLAALVHAAEAGGPVRLTRRGRPVAVILSEREYKRLTGERPGFWAALQAFQGSVAPDALVGAAEAFGAVRDRTPGRDVLL